MVRVEDAWAGEGEGGREARGAANIFRGMIYTGARAVIRRAWVCTGIDCHDDFPLR